MKNYNKITRRNGIGLVCSVLFAPVLTGLGCESNPIKCLADVENYLNYETGGSRAVTQNYIYCYLVTGHSSIFTTNLRNALQRNHKAHQIVESLRGVVRCREQYAEMRLTPQLIH